MLDTLELTNYRNLRLEGGLKFNPLTVFVGPNGSGKTNLIRALRFSQDAWISTVDERRGVTRFQSAVARWGGGRILDRRLENPASVDVNIKLAIPRRGSLEFTLTVAVSLDNRVRLIDERMLVHWQQHGVEKTTAIYHADFDDPFADGPTAVVAKGRVFKTEGEPFEVIDLPENQLAGHSLEA